MAENLHIENQAKHIGTQAALIEALTVLKSIIDLIVRVTNAPAKLANNNSLTMFKGPAATPPKHLISALNLAERGSAEIETLLMKLEQPEHRSKSEPTPGS